MFLNINAASFNKGFGTAATLINRLYFFLFCPLISGAMSAAILGAGYAMKCFLTFCRNGRTPHKQNKKQNDDFMHV